MSYREDDEKSLDQVQRWIISALLIVVGGAPTAALAAYSSHIAPHEFGSAVGLWVMSCILGLAVAGGVLVVHRRFPVSPWVAFGLVPGLIAAYYIFVKK
jgi:hypothetical protein